MGGAKGKGQASGTVFEDEISTQKIASKSQVLDCVRLRSLKANIPDLADFESLKTQVIDDIWHILRSADMQLFRVQGPVKRELERVEAKTT